jgi:pyridoxal phosphate enzyme (YggS family)
MSTIAENIAAIRARIDAAARTTGRTGADITLVAATKMNDAARVREAVAAGIDACGENRVQEMTEKLAQGAYTGAPLHFIGHLQTNKVRQVVGKVDLIQSVDSPELLAMIEKRAAGQGIVQGIVQDILLEVNIGGEAAKSGVAPAALPELLETAAGCAHIRVRGLMAIPPVAETSDGNHAYFAKMHELFVDIGRKKYDNVFMDFLSMGMSGDFEDAISAGANMVRVGSSIFGARDYSRH